MTAAAASPRFVVTGPSGWIGQAMLDALVRKQGGKLDGSVSVFASTARTMTLPSGETLEVRALDTITPGDVAGAHVVHLAYLTKEKADLLGEAAFDATNDAIDGALLGAIGGAAPASLFVASSGAAAVAERGADRHPYGLAKLRQEARFLACSAASGVPTIAGRIFNVAGPHINKVRSYAVSDFALQAREDGKIGIQAAVPVFRSYLHVDDLCALVIGAALGGIDRPAPLDFAGAEVVEMAEIAALVAELSGGVPVYRGMVDFTKPSVYVGDATHAKVLAMEIGAILKPLSVQVADTIAWLGAVARADTSELAGIA